MKTQLTSVLTTLLCIGTLGCSESNTSAPPDTPVVTNGKIYFIEFDSSGVASTYSTDGSAPTPKLFISGSIAVSNLRNNKMLVVRPDRNGGGSASIVNESGVVIRELGLSGDFNMPLVLSPNGDVLLYVAEDVTYHLKNLSTGADVELTSLGCLNGAAQFSRDGRRVAFYEYFDASASDRPDRLVIANVDGTERVVVTDSAKSFEFPNGSLDWSAAGDRLYFTRGGDFGMAIWSATLDGSEPKLLTGSMPLAFEPAVSPDGKSLAFVGSMFQEGPADIWIMSTDGSNLRRLTAGAARHIAASPSWSADGRYITYIDNNRANGAGGATLQLLDIASAATTLLDAGPMVLFAFWDS